MCTFFFLLAILNAVEVMVGFPPPSDRLVDRTNWMDPPFNRWGFFHARRIEPTADVTRGEGLPTPLPAEARDLSSLQVADLMGREISFSEYLEKTFTDAFLVLHRGKIVYEWGNTREPHSLWSISKGFLGVLAAAAKEEGKLEVGKKVSHYIPELAGTQYGEVTVEQLLDMEVVPTDPTRVDLTPYSIDEYVPSFQKDKESGKVFFYTSITSEVLGWVLERATATYLPDYLSGKIWKKIGAERSAYYTLDHKGRARVGGGLNASARDLARFSLALFGGALVSHEWIQKTFWEGEGKAFQNSPFSLPLPKGNYEDHWWKFNGNEGPFLALGIYGQYLWIDPNRDLILVKLSSEPAPVDLENSYLNIMMFKKIEEVLR